MNTVVYKNGNGQFVTVRPLDAFTGKPITRTKQSHPYNYQPFEVWSSGGEGDASVWSDRLFQWDSKKFNECCKAVWGNTGQAFDTRTATDIERFLRLYLENNKLVLNRIVECCNQSSGFPLWYFGYSENKVG